MEREIITDENELSEICEYVDTKKSGQEMRDTILAIKDTMQKHDLIALSAPQIGSSLRIFCVKDKDGYHSFVNPMIKKSVELTFSREKDVSIPNKEYIYPRSSKIVVNYQTPLGDMKATTVVGYSAFIFEQMIDHLNGVLISDIGLEIDEQWDTASEEEREKVLEEYIKSLDLVSKKLNEDIMSDEELSKQMKAIEFEHELISGNLEIEQVPLSDEDSKAVEEKVQGIKVIKTEIRV